MQYILFNFKAFLEIFILGSRLSLEDQELKTFVGLIDELVKESSNVSIINVFPFLRHLFSDLTGWTKTKNIMGKMSKFIDQYIQTHITNFNRNKEIITEDPNDFIEAFLCKIDESSTDSSFHGQLGLNNLKGTYISPNKFNYRLVPDAHVQSIALPLINSNPPLAPPQL